MFHDQSNAEVQSVVDEPKAFRDDAGSIDGDPNYLLRWYDLEQNAIFGRYLLFTVIMIIWPWIFFGIVCSLGGVRLHRSMAEAHQRDTLYFVTAICSIIGLTAAHIFSKAVGCLAQKRVVHKKTAIFHITFFAALKNRTPTLSLFRQGKPHLFVVVIVYLIIFALIVPGLTALLTPINYSQKVNLHGTELDFTSNDPDCIDWFNNNNNFTDCNWESYRDAEYTFCLVENQVVDVLESGRGNILSLLQGPNTSITYIELGAPGGLHFVGSIKGLLPNGPNGLPAFDTLDSSSNAYFASHPTYNYTLDLQGVSSDVTCNYSNPSPITLTPLDAPENFMYSYNATCPVPPDGLPYILANTTYDLPISYYALTSWTCQTAPNSFTVYLRGVGRYNVTIGNITCTISSIQPTVIPLEYIGQTSIFTAQPPRPVSNLPNSGNLTQILASNMVRNVGSVVWETQSASINLMAESILTLGVKAFHLPPTAQDERYLGLCEAMIEGILDYEATYIRLLYSIKAFNDTATTPHSCFRQFNGSADLESFGWSRSSQNAAYLLPITLVNLTTLVILVIAMRTGTNLKLLPRFDPTDAESLILSHDSSGIPLSTVTSQPTNPIPWRNLVAFGKNKDGIYRLWPKDEVVPE